MQVTLIIPNFNGRALLQKNLAEIIAVSPGAQVVVVDDGSTDGSVAYLKHNFPKIKLLEKATNSGFATTVNLGVKATEGEIILLLNTDAVPQKDFLAPILAHFKDERVFAVGCLDKSVEGDKIIKRGRGVGKFRRGFLVHARGEVNLTNTLWVSGGSGAFRRSIWEKLGGMDSLYDPFYWEDIDLSYRAVKSGCKILFEPKSVIKHIHSQGSIQKQYSEKEIQKIAYRNQLIFFWKNITDTGFLIRHILWLKWQILRAVVGGDTIFMKGFLAALLRLPEIIRHRRRVSAGFKKTDREVVAPFVNEL